MNCLCLIFSIVHVISWKYKCAKFKCKCFESTVKSISFDLKFYICNFLFNSQYYLSFSFGNMKVIQRDQKRFKCELCDVRFTSKRNIPRHMKLKHFDENSTHFQCYHCTKVYQTKGNHDTHFDNTHLVEQLLYMQPEEVKGALISKFNNRFLLLSMSNNLFGICLN